MKTPLTASGLRTHWDDLDTHIRALIEERLGSTVIESATQSGGFSPGLAARVRTRAGTTAFIKAVHPARNPDSPRLHRREARISAALPHGLQVPQLLWWIDEGPEGWVVLAFEVVDGHQPRLPWSATELNRVVAALIDLADRLTPSPIEIERAGELFSSISSWRRITARDCAPWIARHIDELIACDEQALRAVEGESLIHLDIRDDNILLTDSSVFFVDWPHAGIGAPWVDAVGMAPSVAMQGGPAPEEFLGRFPSASEARHEDVTAVISCLAGFLFHRSLQPELAELPGLRGFQGAQARVALDWLARRMAWSQH